ncbi:MAG: gamma-glutamyl kinase [Thaumarchaeota archaeon]|nr:gamma-glutamyl kinase [Nitrososphaerota archaeon]|tara:strand:+ start:609 stop:1367 length:759 start_codon:yes stop_codon:yes gene_type:complete
MGLAILKLGGSVVTFKNKPLSLNKNAIKRISKSLCDVNTPLIIVHGGGSFGHYYSKKYDMHTKPARYDIHGVSVVKSSMVELNSYIVKIMVKNKLNPYSVSPSSLVYGTKSSKNNIDELEQFATNSLIPVTYGDVLHYTGRSYYILSGDVLMTILAKELKPDVVIFTMNVDGVYRDMKNKEIVREIHNMKQIKIDDIPIDVTGGINRKIKEAFKISRMGIDVLMVNGLKPDRIITGLNNKKVKGTIIRGVNK